MAGTAVTDLNTAIADIQASDTTLGLATGVNVTDQLNAVKVKLQEANLMISDLRSLGLSNTLDTALGVVATDLS